MERVVGIGMSDKVSIKHRKGISSSQLVVLELLFKYRFGSIELLKISLGLKTEAGLFRKLAILLEQGYIGRYFNKDYRIERRSAEYYIATKGLRELQKLPKYHAIDDNFVQYNRKDAHRSDEFRIHTLKVYRIALELARLHPDLKFFTQRELAGNRNFPKQHPDGYLVIKSGETSRRFFLDCVPDDTPRYIIDKKVSDYTDFFETGGWDKTKSELPVMLFICHTGRFERRMQNLIVKKRYSLSSDEPEYYTTTLKALIGAQGADDAIWSDVEEPEDLLALQDC